MLIQEVHGRIIRNSRGEQAIEVVVNKKYKASAPSGASTGSHEVPCFSSKGIRYSVDFLNKHAKISGARFEEFSDLAVFDPWVSKIGGNAVVALQSACLQAMSEGDPAHFLSSRLKFPIPLGNCVGGGAHVRKGGTDIQEFLLLPQGKTFRERAVLNRYVYEMIKKLQSARTITDEGAFVLPYSDEEVFAFLIELLEDIHGSGLRVSLGVDIAASQFYHRGMYHYKNFSFAQKKKIFSPQKQISLVNTWVEKYHLAYVEDPLQEEDFSGFSKIHKKTLVCGDDLVTTNVGRLYLALRNKSVNSIIVKPNQIGSLIKTKEIIDFCRTKGVKTILSHRSGETMDTMIADLAAAWHVPYIKTGIFGKEREAKLQRLIFLEDK